jgi:hypothetical protein
MYTMFVRGDNQPSYATYLGYLSAKDLYPEFKPISYEDCVNDVLNGNAPKFYADKF